MVPPAALSGGVWLSGANGGVVMTGAASGNQNVKALVYVAAFAPEANEPVGPLTEKHPSALGTALLPPDAAGYLSVDRKKFRDVFAADVPAAEVNVIAATQKPVQRQCIRSDFDGPSVENNSFGVHPHSQ